MKNGVTKFTLLLGVILWVGQPLLQCLNAQESKPMRLFSSAVSETSLSEMHTNARVSLDKILAYLQERYNVQFFYQDDALKGKYGPAPEALLKEKPGEALAQLLTSLNLGYTKIGKSTYVIYPRDTKPVVDASKNIQFAVSGKVTDATSGEALPGVNVLVKGTSNGTATDANGQYQLDISSGADTLVFSYIGYQSQTVPVNDRHEINAALQIQAVQGQEMVVVGYGEQKQADITGSITSITTDQIKQVPVTDVGQALEGKVAGLNITQGRAMPGTSPSIMVRGQNSISASNNPLIVVDGTPFSGGLNDINQSDISNISVLKGPSATAIYGTRGSNGVILITTKKGKKGKPQITYNGYVGTGGYAHKLTPGSPQQYLEKWKWYQLESGIPQDQLTPVPNSPGGNEYINYKAGKTVNWLSEISQPAYSTDNNLKISGGTNTVTYYISGEFMKQQGIIKGYNFERTNVRANIDANVTDYLDVGTNLFYNANNYDGGQAALLFAEEMSPYGTLRNSDGTYAIHPDAPELLYTNPFLPTLEDRVSRYKRLDGKGYAIFKPGFIQGLGVLKGLQYKLNASYSYDPSRYADYVGRAAGSTQNGNATVNNTTDSNWLVENILTYQKDFGDSHIDFTGLYSAQKFTHFFAQASATGFINDMLSFNNLGAGATQAITSYNSNGDGTYSYSLLSQMGRINYSYKNKYLLTLTARRDGYSAFGANTSKYGLFPTAAVGWNISNEKFMQNVHAVNNLKLRFSYGRTGNQAIRPNQTETTDGVNLYPFNSVAMIGTYPSVLGNANLHWETSTTSDLGVDFGILKNRIRGTIDYYSTDTKGLLLQRQLPAITGYGSVWANLGETKNKGLEVTLNTTNLQAGGFIWTSDITFATNRNKIVDLYGDKKSDLGNRWFIGQPINVIYDYKMLGVWQTSEAAQAAKYNAKPGDLKIADINGVDTNGNLTGQPDQQITADDRTILGSPDPKWTGGLNNTFYYKNFNLRIFIQTVQGVLKYNTQLNWVDLAGRRNIPADLTYWTPDNHNNSMPALTYTNTIGYGYPRNASYTRLKDVTLTYNLPQSVAEKAGLGGLSVYLSGHNLITWTPWLGWSPEVDYTGRGGTNFTSNNYPQPRTVVLGVNITL